VPKEVLDELFDRAREHYHDGEHVEAARVFYEFHLKAPEADDRYEWSEYFLARALSAAGYLHAAAEYDFNVVKYRRVPMLLPESLGELEKLSRDLPYDRVMVERDLVDDIEFPDHLPDLLNDFVHYVQGYWNLRRNNEKWFKDSFSRIRGDGLYRMKADLYTALWLLRSGRAAEAMPVFEELAKHEPEDSIDAEAEEVVRDDARETLARLAYETGDYEQAWELYAGVVDPRRERPQLPLEKAWVLYYRHDWSRTLGLLHALDSPWFRDAFLPDKYLLRGIIFSNLCHFRAAAAAVDAFRARFGPSLKAIRARADLTTDPSLEGAAVATGKARRIDRFLSMVLEERSRAAAEDEWLGSPLAEHLEELYSLEEDEVRKRWWGAVQAAFDDLSAKLIDYEEQINLLDYEVGIALYRRVKRGEQKAEAREAKLPTVPIWDGFQYARPRGEYWNDELHDYRVLIKDRCDAPARWE